MNVEINEAFYHRACLQVTGVGTKQLVQLGALFAALSHMGQKGHLAPPPKRAIKDPQLEALGKLVVMALRQPGFFEGLDLDHIPDRQCPRDCPAAQTGFIAVERDPAVLINGAAEIVEA